MSSSKKEAKSPTPPSRWLWTATAAVSALGALTSAYLTWGHYAAKDAGGWDSLCEVGSRFSCDVVATSEYSAVAGLPLAWLAAIFYAALGWLSLRVLRGTPTPIPRSPALALLGAGLLASLLSLALAGVSALLIGAFCPLCVLLYALNAALLALGVLARRGGASGGLVKAGLAEARNLRRHAMTTAALALLAAVLLAAPSLARSFRPPIQDLCGFLGEDPAKARLVVYSDFQCPFCGKADALLDEVRGAPGVTLVKRHFPLDRACNPRLARTLHPGACLQSSAAICAQSKGVDLGPRLFAKGPKDAAGLVALAAREGLDPAAFEACLGAPETERALTADIDAARSEGVEGTPALFVNGRRYRGPLEPGALRCLAPRPAR